MKMRGGGGPLKEEGGEGDSKVARGPPTVASFLAESPQIRGKEGLRQLGGKHWVCMMMMMVAATTTMTMMIALDLENQCLFSGIVKVYIFDSQIVFNVLNI